RMAPLLLRRQRCGWSISGARYGSERVGLPGKLAERYPAQLSGGARLRYRRAYLPLVSVSGLLYTIPSLVLILTLPGLLGAKILDPLNVAVGLTIYAFALLTRAVAATPGVESQHRRCSNRPRDPSRPRRTRRRR